MYDHSDLYTREGAEFASLLEKATPPLGESNLEVTIILHFSHLNFLTTPIGSIRHWNDSRNEQRMLSLWCDVCLQ
jgi:hypothetical protein